MSQEKKKVENEPGSVGDEESDILRVEKRNERKKYDEDGKFIDEARSKAGKEENGGSVRCLREIVDGMVASTPRAEDNQNFIRKKTKTRGFSFSPSACRFTPTRPEE
ncbi:hypothetical protein RUM44_009502 [Polyplax serrata]|uniref:Uncharacterized protein n=1 Tax=Polyplax serrata TaxID=468196 RepID=A0ABR1ASX4_POLSC